MLGARRIHGEIIELLQGIHGAKPGIFGCTVLCCTKGSGLEDFLELVRHLELETSKPHETSKTRPHKRRAEASKQQKMWTSRLTDPKAT